MAEQDGGREFTCRWAVIEDAGLRLGSAESSLDVGELAGERLDGGAGGAESSGHRAEILAEGDDALGGGHCGAPMQRASSCPATVDGVGAGAVTRGP